MSDKILRKLNRAELLELLIEQGKEADELRGQVQELTEKLSEAEATAAEAMAAAAGAAGAGETEPGATGTGATAATAGATKSEATAAAGATKSGTTKSGKSKPTAKDYGLPAMERELKRIRYKKNYRRTLRSTIGTLIVVAAIAVLIATLFLPVLQIYGTSMSPTLVEGDIVLSVKESNLRRGEIIAFYYNNKILVKRVIAHAGEWVNIDENGVVSIDGAKLPEPYLIDQALGDCDIILPYQVPEGRVFVMGDHRSVSVDSRSTSVGCVAEEQIVGRLIYRIWPLDKAGYIE